MVNQSSKIGTRWVVHIDGQLFPVMIKPVSDGYNIRYTRGRIYVRTNWTLGSLIFGGVVNGRKVNVKVDNIPTGYMLTHSGTSANVYVRSPRISELESIMPVKEKKEFLNLVKAPLTGQIIAVKVKEGDEVKIGQDLAILTAMKMENIITSRCEGKIAKVSVVPGDQVSMGQVIIEFEED
jgi:propionyl-CoA carboxylase alpha chain